MTTTTLNKMAQLKFNGMLRSYKTMLETNQHHDLNADEVISTLMQAEWEEREGQKVARNLRLAKFRYGASVEEVNFTAARGLDKTQVLRLAEGSFIKRRENLLITGATGVGYAKQMVM
jgi:DNA replication protein DnaC